MIYEPLAAIEANDGYFVRQVIELATICERWWAPVSKRRRGEGEAIASALSIEPFYI